MDCNNIDDRLTSGHNSNIFSPVSAHKINYLELEYLIQIDPKLKIATLPILVPRFPEGFSWIVNQAGTQGYSARHLYFHGVGQVMQARGHLDALLSFRAIHVKHCAALWPITFSVELRHDFTQVSKYFAPIKQNVKKVF